jgi:Xaa-Pro aminopeptidase
LFEAREYGKALRAAMEQADLVNAYVDSNKPWELAKKPENDAKLQEVCSRLLEAFRILTIFLKPVLPQLAAQVEAIALANHGRLSYPTILTGNGQTLHNHYHGNTIQDGQMVLVDAGAETSMHYAGDLTRTFPAGKQFTTRQRELYTVVLQALDHAVSLLRPGIQYKEVHTQACIKLAEGLTAVGLMKGDATAAVAAGAHTMFFQCGLGHMIGMYVHDMEDLGEPLVGYDDQLKKSTEFGWKSLRLGKALKAGFTLTVEPGIYIIPELIDRWKAEQKHTSFINYDLLNDYRNFGGIRIEDNFVITDNGSQKLGKSLPKSLDEIEAMRKG